MQTLGESGGWFPRVAPLAPGVPLAPIVDPVAPCVGPVLVVGVLVVVGMIGPPIDTDLIPPSTQPRAREQHWIMLAEKSRTK